MFTRARASQSIQRVAAQELRNLTRLRAAAVREGREVIFADIRFLPGRDGSFQTLRAGRTVVKSIPRESALPDPQQGRGAGGAEDGEPAASASDAAQTSQPASAGDAQELKDDLRTALRAVERRLERADSPVGQDSTRPLGDPEAERRRLEREEREIKRALARLEAADLAGRLAELQGVVAEVARRSIDQAADLAGVARGAVGDTAVPVRDTRELLRTHAPGVVLDLMA